MELLHMCRLCLKNSDYHFNIFTEIISNNHLYQLINQICELGISYNDGLPEHICDSCFQSFRNIISFKTRAKETEVTLTSMKRFRNMILSKLKEKEQVEEAVDSAVDQSTINQEEVSAISLDKTTSPDEGKSISQELAIKSETDIDEIVNPTEQVEILKITEMEESASFEHFNEMEIIPAVIEKSESKEFLEVRRKLECYHCGEKRETKQEIAEHIEDAHNYMFNEDDTPIQQQREDKEHSCSMCDRRYKKNNSLTRHMRKHTGEKPYQCNICNHSFSQSTSLKTHMLVHTGERPFQCNVCNFSTTTSGSLTVHMRKHTGERPFQCNICDYSSSRRCTLRKHMQRHTGEKPFQCNICDYSSSSRFARKVHMRKHTGEKPFHCNICNYSCSQSGNLQVHMQKHTGKKK